MGLVMDLSVGQASTLSPFSHSQSFRSPGQLSSNSTSVPIPSNLCPVEDHRVAVIVVVV